MIGVKGTFGNCVCIKYSTTYAEWKSSFQSIKGTFLSRDAICSLLMRQCEGDGIKESERSENENVNETDRKADAPKNELLGLYEKLTSGDIDLESLYSNDYLADKYLEYQSKCRNLSQYPTSALWIQYLKMIDILRTFITAERTGNWDLGLKSLRDMLPFFAAAGHNLYLRSVYLYLQCMQNLHVSNPEVYASFKHGQHVIRRTDRFWAGLSPDLVIEQVLMRSVKTTGGMTRGKGLSDSRRSQWFLSLPACVEINNAMQSIWGREFHTSPQHKEAGKSRSERDYKDTCTFFIFCRRTKPISEG